MAKLRQADVELGKGEAPDLLSNQTGISEIPPVVHRLAAEGYGAGAVARSQVTFKIDGAVTGVGTCATGLGSLIPEPGTATIFAMVLICTVRRRRAFN